MTSELRLVRLVRTTRSRRSRRDARPRCFDSAGHEGAAPRFEHVLPGLHRAGTARGGGVTAQGGRNETLAWAQPCIAARPLPCGLEKARAVRIDRLCPSWEHPAVPGAATEEG